MEANRAGIEVGKISLQLKVNIAISGKARSGKDTVGDYIKSQRPNSQILKFATPLKQSADGIQKSLGLEVCKDPVLMQSLAKTLKSRYGEDVFVDQLSHKLVKCEDKKISVIITDLRFLNEYSLLSKLGFILLRINRPNREIDRDPNDISETELDNCKFDYYIENDWNMSYLYDKVDEFMANIPAIVGLKM